MKFGEKPISKCIGDLLVHSVKLPDGKLPKGTSLSKAHIQKLRSVGLTSILVASLEEGDVDESHLLAERLRGHWGQDPQQDDGDRSAEVGLREQEKRQEVQTVAVGRPR